jgi:hypothetical protein
MTLLELKLSIFEVSNFLKGICKLSISYYLKSIISFSKFDDKKRYLFTKTLFARSR